MSDKARVIRNLLLFSVVTVFAFIGAVTVVSAIIMRTCG